MYCISVIRSILEIFIYFVFIFTTLCFHFPLEIKFWLYRDCNLVELEQDYKIISLEIY